MTTVSSDGVHIRDMRPDDAERVAALASQLGYPSATADVARRLPPLLGRADHRLIVAADPDDRVVGWVHVLRRADIMRDDFVQVVALVVDEARRSLGIGTRLLDEAERWAVDVGADAVTLSSRVARSRAHAFYERAGYTISKTSLFFSKTLRSTSGKEQG